MELTVIPPPITRGSISIQVNISYLPKHIESLLEVTISYSKTNPNIEGSFISSCSSLTCLLHKTYVASNNSLLIQESIGNVLEGFYLVEMTLNKNNSIGDSIARIYGIWGTNSSIVIGLPYSIFKPIEFA